MTISDLIQKDLSAKSYHGKSDGDLACKYYEPVVDLSSHTPTHEVRQMQGDPRAWWALTQSGAAAVTKDYKIPDTTIGYTYDGVNQYHNTGVTVGVVGAMEVDIRLLDVPGSLERPVGLSGNSARCYYQTNVDGTMQFFAGSEPTSVVSFGQMGDSVRRVLKATWEAGSSELFTNGVLQGVHPFTSDPSTTLAAYIGGRNVNGVADAFANCEVYRFRIWGANNTLLFDTKAGWGTPVNNPTPITNG